MNDWVNWSQSSVRKFCQHGDSWEESHNDNVHKVRSAAMFQHLPLFIIPLVKTISNNFARQNLTNVNTKLLSCPFQYEKPRPNSGVQGKQQCCRETEIEGALSNSHNGKSDSFTPRTSRLSRHDLLITFCH